MEAKLGYLVYSLATLFNASLHFLLNWKWANIYPVFKSGDFQLLINYRPISVLPCIHQQVFSYFITNNLLTPAQSGFHPGHNTQDLLLKVVED